MCLCAHFCTCHHYGYFVQMLKIIWTDANQHGCAYMTVWMYGTFHRISRLSLCCMFSINMKVGSRIFFSTPSVRRIVYSNAKLFLKFLCFVVYLHDGVIHCPWSFMLSHGVYSLWYVNKKDSICKLDSVINTFLYVAYISNIRYKQSCDNSIVWWQWRISECK